MRGVVDFNTVHIEVTTKCHTHPRLVEEKIIEIK